MGVGKVTAPRKRRPRGLPDPTIPPEWLSAKEKDKPAPMERSKTSIYCRQSVRRRPPDYVTKTAVIAWLARNRVVEEMIRNTAKGTENPAYDDLAQMIYLSLLEKDEEKIRAMYEKGELRWFIARMVVNNLRSTTSPFWYRYRKPTIYQPIEDIITDEMKDEYAAGDREADR